MNFSNLNLPEPILENLRALGYVNPTPIQEQVIPLILDQHDLLGIAQTGTGKTAAFCLPLIATILNSPGSKGIKVLVLAPTRELSTQIKHSFDKYAKGLGLKSVVLFGGVNQKSQVEELKSSPDVVVATPGRLLDLVSQGFIKLIKVQAFVMDEADQMLDMGFIEDIENIIKHLPKKRQNLFFSATMPLQVENLSKRILVNPKRIEVTPQSSTVLEIDQKVIFCKREDKFQLLKKILKQDERELVIVFTKTKNSADKVKEYLISCRIASTVFHGDKPQEERERALANFKAGSMKVLIATDIAARGLDVSGISHVINFELPLEAENYVHRIGRTARAGEKGVAISFCEDSEKPNLERIEKLINLKIPTEKFKGVPEAAGKWLQEGPVKIQAKSPTPGQSQEKKGFIDHSKRQRVAVGEQSKAKSHPGLKNKKKRR